MYIYIYIYTNHAPKCMSCHKAGEVLTGRAHRFHDCILYIQKMKNIYKQMFTKKKTVISVSTFKASGLFNEVICMKKCLSVSFYLLELSKMIPNTKLLSKFLKE